MVTELLLQLWNYICLINAIVGISFLFYKREKKAFLATALQCNGTSGANELLKPLLFQKPIRINLRETYGDA